MSDITTNEAVLSKVKKLLALSESSNESEASVAMEKAHKLLLQYNLSLSDVKQDNEYGVTEEVQFTCIRERKWRIRLMSAVAKLNLCTFLIRRSARKGGSYQSMVLIGKEHNIAGAKVMIDYMASTIERLSKSVSGSERGSYQIGLTNAVCEKIFKMMKKEQEECKALVLSEKAMIKQFLSGQKIKTTEISTKVSNANGYYKGQADVDKVSFNRQMDSIRNNGYMIGGK